MPFPSIASHFLAYIALGFLLFHPHLTSSLLFHHLKSSVSYSEQKISNLICKPIASTLQYRYINWKDLIKSTVHTTMSIPETSSTSQRNGTTSSALSQSNVAQIPRTSRSSIENFVRAPAAELPYFAGARMQERSTYLRGLSNQLDALDQIFNTST
ncbi:hypothetical protein PENDEC_c030G03380 [Penicillium decumbens]|uniref:Uncharacterized protein n=1 Tax=Penicillium decumbens TaxID=69771 RepID=A0A1V6NVQ4_PENDC|nr:hypothetical protein PENDEC_c030G03380 [Penicillium decumbens]